MELCAIFPADCVYAPGSTPIYSACNCRYKKTAFKTPNTFPSNAHLQVLQQTLKGERASRKSAEAKHRRAQSATIRTSRYLDSVLKVNQELVATTSGMSEPQPSKAQLSRSRAPRAAWREEQNEHRHPAGRAGKMLEGVDVGAAVGEAVMVGRAGGDPVPSLTALYERIGFCAIQGEDGDDEGMQSLPTSPNRAGAGNAQNDDEGTYGRRLGDRAEFDGFPRDSPEVPGSPTPWATGRQLDVGSPGPDDTRGGQVTGNGIKGYSFAHSPIARVTSVAEKSPKVLKRLEALASQLERERADVEQWYKDVVHRVGVASASSQGIGSFVATHTMCQKTAVLHRIVRNGYGSTAPKVLLKAPNVQAS